MADWPSKSFKLIVKNRFAGEWGAEEGGSEVNLPCIRVADFNRFKNIVSDDVPTIRSISKKTAEVKQLQHQDILIEKSGGGDKTPVGTPILYLGSENAICSNFIEVVRLQTGHDPKFWTYVLISSYESGNTRRFINQTTGIQNIDSQRFYDQVFCVPPLRVQQRIADYLDRETAEIDAAVADLDRYGALLEKRKKNQINLAFAPIIEAKEVTPLGVFYSISNGDRGENYPKADEITDQGIPFLNAGDIRKGSVSLNAAKFVTREKYDAMGGAKLRAGDILFCLRGSLGKHGVVDFDEGSVASSLCVIRPLDSSAHSSHFLNYFMETTFFAEQILFAENGSAQPNLSGESLARFRIPASPISEQKRILRDLDRGTAEIDALIEESKKLRDLLLKRRSVLITEVVTGRKQV